MADATDPKHKFLPDVTYEFDLMIGGTMYSTDLIQVEIVSSVISPYQYFYLDIFFDTFEILKYDLFSQQDIYLTMTLYGKVSHEVLETTIFSLMYIDTESDYTPTKMVKMNDQLERKVIRLKTIPIPAYKTISTLYNQIYFEWSVEDIVMDVARFLIPPSTIYKTLFYLDKVYGIFHGPLALFCTFDNILKIMNLGYSMVGPEAVILYILATDEDNTEILESRDPRVFYTPDPLMSSYKGTSAFSVLAPTIKYIVKPRDMLYYEIPVELEGFCDTYGLISGNPAIYYNKYAIGGQRVGYEKDQTGYDLSDSFIHSNLSQNIFDLAALVTSASGNLRIFNLSTMIGNKVMIISKIDDYQKVAGDYLLRASELKFIKTTVVWESFARVYLSRTNPAFI